MTGETENHGGKPTRPGLPEPSYCTSLSTQHVRLSGVTLRQPADSLKLAAR